MSSTPLEFDLHQLRSALVDWNLAYFPELESTNDWALQAFCTTAPPTPTVVVARAQTRGRGRGLHTWRAPPGNLTCSFAFPIAADPIRGAVPPGLSREARLTLSSSIAMALTALNYLPPESVQIKWPNDLLLSGRKAAGVLIETKPLLSPDADHCHLAVIGIGFNVNSAPRVSELSDAQPVSIPPVALAEFTQSPVPLTELLLKLCNHLTHLLVSTRLILLPRNSSPTVQLPDHELIDQYGQFLAWRGKRVCVQCGAQKLEGNLLGVEQSGQLLIQMSDGAIRALASGELRLAYSEEAANQAI
jgi:BirA family biotin operon repressor/biotin-[acetyl-CoA-carboxylase] ligase